MPFRTQRPPRPAAIVWTLATAAAFGACLVLHLPVSDYCDAVIRRVGFGRIDTRARAAAALAAVLFVASIHWRARAGRLRLTLAAAAVVGFAALSSRALLVSGLEAAHYPQYAVLFGLLRAATGSADTAWRLSTGLGVADEWYQYAALPRGTPPYFDWNDVVLDATGATCGLLLARALGDRSGGSKSGARGVMMALTAALAALAEAVARGGLFAAAPGGKPAVVLTAAQALTLAACLWTAGRAAAPRDPRREIKAASGSPLAAA